MAAEVADATRGFVMLLHIPKDRMLTMGLLSRIVAAGLLVAVTRFVGKTSKLLDMTPKEHVKIAPATTSCGI